MRRLCATAAVVVLTVTLGGCGAGFAGDPEAGWRDRDGKVVSEKVITSYYGAEHCDTQSVVFIDVGWPIGTATSDLTRRRQYVRDRHKSLPVDVLPRTLDLDARLPTTARFSGFRTEKMELWLSPEDQHRAAYVVVDKEVERWPRATRPIYCA